MASNVRYSAIVRRDAGGGWTAAVKELEGAEVQAATLESLGQRIREALSNAGAPAGALYYQWPTPILRLVLAAEQTKTKALQAEAAAQEKAAEAARGLMEMGLSLRDVANLLSISHQRVVQLLARAETYPDGGRRWHEADGGEMEESSRRAGGSMWFKGGPVQRVDHVFGVCKKCGAAGRWTEAYPAAKA
jgi:hypothetical protein